MFSSAFVRICGCGRKCVVHGISVCMALCALCVSAATVTWTGAEDSFFSNVNNWQDGRKPADSGDYVIVYSEGAQSLVIAEGDELNCERFYITYSLGHSGEVEQTGGRVTLSGNSVADLSLGYSSFIPNDKQDWNEYKISGGEIVDEGIYGGMIIGCWSRGRLVQSGGSITLGGNIYLAEQAGTTHQGEYLMSGGTLLQTGAASVMRVGIGDRGKWILSGDAKAKLSTSLEIGLGEGVSLGGNARLELKEIFGGASGAPRFVFDGGTLVLKEGVTESPAFISKLAAAEVASGGAKIDIPSGAVAIIRQPLTAAPESAGGGLVKKGGGMLVLAGNDSYAGGTKVEAGVLGLPRKMDVSTLTIEPGANVAVVPAFWDEQSLSELKAKAVEAGNGSYEIMDLDIELADGETMTISDDLDLAGNGLVLRGNGILKLTGSNNWTGETRLVGGVLAAKRGEGLPMGSKLVMAGGAWAPLDGSGTVAAKIEPGLLEVETGAPYALAAVDGDESVDIAGAPVFDKPAEIKVLGFTADGDSVLTVTNKMSFASETEIYAEGKLVLSAAVDSKARLTVSGAGTVELADSLSQSGGDFAIQVNNAVLPEGSSVSVLNHALVYSQGGTTLDIGKDAKFQGTADIRIGDGNGSKGVVNVNGGEFSTTGYLHAGRRGTATGTLNVDGGVVSAGNIRVGEGQSEATVNQRGGIVKATYSFKMGNDRNEAGGNGTAVYNLEAGTLDLSSNNNDPEIGCYGTAYFNLRGGEVIFPSRYAYMGCYGKTYFNHSGGIAKFPSRTHLNYRTSDTLAPNAYTEYNLTGGEVVSGGDWRVGNHGRGVFNVSGGTFSTSGYLHVGADTSEKKGNGDGTVNFIGGTSTMNSRTWIASSSNAKGEVNIDTGTDGSIEFKGDVSVGYSGAGELNMKSGSVLQSVGYLYVGQNAGSKGVMKMTGGEYSLTYPGGVVCIGHQGDGTLEIAGGALRTVGSARVSMGPYASNPNYSGSASLKISDGGILETGRFHAGYGSGHGSITVDNGTIRAAGSAGDFFENVDITIGAGGLTLDSNGFDVNGSGAVFSGASAGVVRKIGAGTFSLHDLPNAKAGVKVEQGTLQVVPYALRHRWSFNGSFADSVSGALPVLTADTAFTEDGTAFKMVSTTRVDLGRNVLPVDHDSTIEMWVTRRDRGTWEKLLTLGSGKSDVVMVGLQNNNEDTAIVSVVDDDAAGGKFASENTTGLGTMTVGEKFHVSITVRRTSAATTEFTFRMKQMDGTPAGSVVLTSTGTLATLNQQNCLLGQNPWNNPSSACDIDEIRVWDVALTDEQLTANVALGPDALPDFGSGQDVTDHETVLPEKIGGLSASDYLVHRWKFDGTLDDEVTGSGPRDFAGVAYTDDGKALRLAGGGKWANYVNLGSGLLPGDDTPVTIEFWATDREYREWAKAFSFGNSKQDLLSLNTNSGSETNPGYLTFVSTAWGHGTEDMPKFSENRFGRRLYYAIVIVPDGTGQAEAVFRIKDGDTGAFVEEHSRMVHWTPAQSGQSAFYLGVSYWSNVGPAMDYEEMRFWNAALSDAQCTANALLGPDSPPETFDAIPLTVEVAQGARLDFGGRRLRLHNLSSAGIISASAVTADGVVSPCGDGTAGVMKVDGSLTVTGTLCLDLGDRIEATGDVVLDGAKIVFNASDEEVNEYVRSHGRWALVTSSSGRVSAAGIKTGRYSFDISAGGSGLWAVMRGFFIKIR